MKSSFFFLILLIISSAMMLFLINNVEAFPAKSLKSIGTVHTDGENNVPIPANPYTRGCQKIFKCRGN